MEVQIEIRSYFVRYFFVVPTQEQKPIFLRVESVFRNFFVSEHHRPKKTGLRSDSSHFFRKKRFVGIGIGSKMHFLLLSGCFVTFPLFVDAAAAVVVVLGDDASVDVVVVAGVVVLYDDDASVVVMMPLLLFLVMMLVFFMLMLMLFIVL